MSYCKNKIDSNSLWLKQAKQEIIKFVIPLSLTLFKLQNSIFVNITCRKFLSIVKKYVAYNSFYKF